MAPRGACQQILVRNTGWLSESHAIPAALGLALLSLPLIPQHPKKECISYLFSTHREPLRGGPRTQVCTHSTRHIDKVPLPDSRTPPPARPPLQPPEDTLSEPAAHLKPEPERLGALLGCGIFREEATKSEGGRGLGEVRASAYMSAGPWPRVVAAELPGCFGSQSPSKLLRNPSQHIPWAHTFHSERFPRRQESVLGGLEGVLPLVSKEAQPPWSHPQARALQPILARFLTRCWWHGMTLG